MSRKALTFRGDEALIDALTNLSRNVRRPVNQLITEAVRAYLARRSREVELDLEERLAKLRAYREADPDFEKAIDAFAEAEATLPDPVEGTVVGGAGPVRREIRSLLHG